MNSSTVALLLATPLAASLLLLGAADEMAKLVPPSEHTVKLGQLEVEWAGDLRLEPTNSRPVKADTEQWGRSAEISDVIISGGLVHKDDVLMRLDTTDIDEAIDEAKTALAELKTRQDISRRSRKIEAQGMATSLEQNTKAESRARRDLDLFKQFRSEMQQEQQKMGYERSGHYVGDQKIELEQLQEMYGDTTLADRTKDIVLERAERGLDMAQRSFEHTKINNDLWWKYTFPDREMDMQDSVRWKTEQLDHTIIRQQLTRMRWELDEAREGRELKDAEEKLSDLLSDRDRFTIKAPLDGILTDISLEVGDDVGMQQNIAQIHDPSTAQLEGTIDAPALTLLETGMDVTVEAKAFPGLSLPGSIDSIGLVGTPSGSGTSFSIEISLHGNDDRMRLGLACTARATRTLQNVIAVPHTAVQQDGDRSYVMLRRGENIVEQDVITGHGNETSIEIVSGLSAGDHIQLDHDESDD